MQGMEGQYQGGNANGAGADWMDESDAESEDSADPEPSDEEEDGEQYYFVEELVHQRSLPLPIPSPG